MSEPGAVKLLTEASSPEMFHDLRLGLAVRIEVASSTREDGAVVESSGVVSNELRGYGPLPAHAKRRQLDRYSKGIANLRLRVGEVRDQGGLLDALSLARDIALLEECMACYAVVSADEAFFAEYSKMPSLEGWRIVAVQSQSLIVDGDGVIVDDPQNFEGPPDSLKVKNLPILIPIKLADFPTLSQALNYQRDMEVEVTKERIDEFNAKSFEDRAALVAQHNEARQAIAALNSSGVARYQEVESWKQKMLWIPYIDPNTLLGRLRR